jgi:hypothetical protein
MLIRSRIAQDFFPMPKRPSREWVLPAIWLIAALACTAAILYAALNVGVAALEFGGLG